MASSTKEDEEWVQVGEPNRTVRAISGTAVILQSSVVARIHGNPYKRSGEQRVIQKKAKKANAYPSPNPVVIVNPNAVVNPQNKAIRNAMGAASCHVFAYILEVAAIFFRCIRTPLAYTMVLALLWLSTGFAIGYASDIFLQAVRPTCKIPGFSNLLPCSSLMSSSSPEIGSPSERPAKWADYHTLTNIQSRLFEQLLKGSADGLSLSLQIKKTEIATSDLIAQVKVSNLNTKERLARSLSDFVQDAKKTGRSLQKFASKVGSAVDNVMAVNEYALKAIRSARAEELSWKWSMGYLPSRSSKKGTETVITYTFGDAMSVLASNMERLIIEAEISLHNLNILEERLGTIHTIVAHEDNLVLSAKTDLLEGLWTFVGGNRKALKSFDHHLSLLKGIARYRKEALQHVVAALQILQAMSNDIEDLRERIAAPNLVGETIPPEVHILSIQSSLDRLRSGRLRVDFARQTSTN